MKTQNFQCRYCNSKDIDFTGHICTEKKPKDYSMITKKEEKEKTKHEKKT